MNAFFEHHQNNIKFRYRCFDRILLNGCIQSFLDGARAQGFFWVYRKTYPVSRNVLREVANQYHKLVFPSQACVPLEVSILLRDSFQ